MKLLIFWLLIFPSYFFAQNLKVNNLHIRNYFQYDSTALSITSHSGIKPIIVQKSTVYKHKLSKSFNQNTTIYPLVDMGFGLDSKTKSVFTTGLGLGIDYSLKKFAVSAKILPYFHQGGYVRDSVLTYFSTDVAAGRAISSSLFLQGEFILTYQPNKFFTFLGGIGKNSFGEGYRSLLLSDNAAPNPFLKMETSFWGIKYVNLFNVWNDFSQNPTDKNKDITKLSAIHYLSWNISKKINLSIFESVIWQARDSLTSRYFEPNYLNPFVMYRPVEYAQGSADNVLLGLNLSFKPNPKTTFYGQLVLDEFLLAEIRARDKWWANKFGIQIGTKSKNFIVSNLFAQVEFNMVRPFTFSHQQSPQNYGHANSSVTHPLGANFYELNSILSYQHKQHQFTLQLAYAMFGTDTSEISYGQDIWQSYGNRNGPYNHSIGQGVQQNIFSTNIFYEYPVKSLPNTYFTARYQAIFHSSDSFYTENHMLTIGVRTRIWNRYDDF